ncbi:hypothetical protein QAD02_013612 [Eretmocerus hayati]|uniref:Uncharacterized protein n=1 Tax=Eretmocerus hayati TaxID=131215 RepID=A0ACC2P355_9HYME|nr:hypothetical protein QAD02_013612 [Eretmocerus hayati]
MDKKTAWLLDPKDVSQKDHTDDEYRCMFALARFINSCVARGFHESIEEKKNFRTVVPLYQRKFQEDSHSCGDFDINLMDVQGRNATFDTNSDPEQYRQRNAAKLIQESEVMSGCVYCGLRREVDDALDCETCERFYHISCARSVGRPLERSCFPCLEYLRS